MKLNEKHGPVQVKYAALESGEKHLHSFVVIPYTKTKLLGFVGPVIFRVNLSRYFCHLTDQHLILEIYPFDELVRSSFDCLFAFTRLDRELIWKKLRLGGIEGVVCDPEGNFMTVPYGLISVDVFVFLGTTLICLRISSKNKYEDIYLSISAVKPEDGVDQEVGLYFARKLKQLTAAHRTLQ